MHESRAFYEVNAVSGYETKMGELTSRILRLIPGNPKILEMENAFDLNGIEGFCCSDLSPSLGQVSIALANAKSLFNRGIASEKSARHPIQPIVQSAGVKRFKENKIIRYLLDRCSLNMNDLTTTMIVARLER